jgi:hypothetical protein
MLANVLILLALERELSAVFEVDEITPLLLLLPALSPSGAMLPHDDPLKFECVSDVVRLTELLL